MKHSLRKLSPRGDDLIAEWEPDTVTPERLQEIQREFDQLMQRGYLAADVTDQRNVLVNEFDPNADLLLIPRMAGGAGR